MSEEIVLYVIPDSHPTQRGLPEELREQTIATALGAVVTDATRRAARRFFTMVPGPDCTPEQVMELQIRFTSQSAQKRYENLMNEWIGSAEVARDATLYQRLLRDKKEHEERVVADEALAERVHLYSDADPRGAHHYARLDAVLRRLDVPFGIDYRVDLEGRPTSTYGLHYLRDARDAERPEIAPYLTQEAREAHARSSGTARELPGWGTREVSATEAKRRVYYYTSTDPNSRFYYRKLDETAKAAGLALKLDYQIGAKNGRAATYGLRYSLDKQHPELAAFTSAAAREAHLRSRIEEFAAYRALKIAADIIYRDSAAQKDKASEEISAPEQTLRPLYLPREPGRQYQGDFEHQVQVAKRAENAIRSMSSERLMKLVPFTREHLAEFNRFRERTFSEGQDIGSREQAYYNRIERGLAFGIQVLKERGIDIDAPVEEKAPARVGVARLPEMLRSGDVPSWIAAPDILAKIPVVEQDAQGRPVSEPKGTRFFGFDIAGARAVTGYDQVSAAIVRERGEAEAGAKTVRVFQSWTSEGEKTNATLSRPMPVKDAVARINELRKELGFESRLEVKRDSALVWTKLDVTDVVIPAKDGSTPEKRPATIVRTEAYSEVKPSDARSGDAQATQAGERTWRYVVALDRADLADPQAALAAGRGVKGFVVTDSNPAVKPYFEPVAGTKDDSRVSRSLRQFVAKLDAEKTLPDPVVVEANLVLNKPRRGDVAPVETAEGRKVFARMIEKGASASAVYGIAEVDKTGNVTFRRSHDALDALDALTQARRQVERSLAQRPVARPRAGEHEAA